MLNTFKKKGIEVIWFPWKPFLKKFAHVPSQEASAAAWGFFPAPGHPLKCEGQGSSAIALGGAAGLIWFKITEYQFSVVL